MDSPTTAADLAPAAAGDEPDGTWVVERHRVRRPLGGLFWLAAVVVPLGLTACVALTRTPVLEQDLHAEAAQALHRAGLAHVKLVVDGRQVLAKVPTRIRTARVESTLLAVPGVQTVQTVSVYASKAEARACAHLQGNLDRVTDHQRIPFVGGSARLAPSATSMLHRAAGLLRVCRSVSVVVGGHTDSHTANGSTISLARARVLVRVLKSQGIAFWRLLPRGYGDQYPIAVGSTADARARNQRGSLVVQEP